MLGGRTVILSDGDLPSLVACAAGVEAVAGDASAVRPCVLPFPSAAGADASRAAAVRTQADLLALTLLPAISPIVESADGEGEVRDLIAATYAAARTGIDRVVWAVTGALGDHLDLDRIAAGADRSVLIGRLVALDATRHGVPSIRIETPYLDLTDRQVADLAADLAVPLETVWWWDSDTLPAQRARLRWGEALEAVGWRLSRS